MLVENTRSACQTTEVNRLATPPDPAPPPSSVLEPADAVSAGAEHTLVEACRAGRLAAFEQLYRTHGAKMKSLAFNLLGNTSDAEDAVQETFLKVYRSLGNFKGESALSTWVFRILINSCYDLRRRKQRRGAEVEVGGEGVPDPPVPAHDHPLRIALEKAVAQLRPRQREVFLLAEVEGFKHQEIAQMLGISETNSKNILFQAKQELRGLLRGAAKA